MVDETDIGTRFQLLSPFLNERTRRLTAAAEAAAIGRGGISLVSRATGVSRRAIQAGLAQLQPPETCDRDRIRRAGGGRHRTVATDATLRTRLWPMHDIGSGSVASAPTASAPRIVRPVRTSVGPPEGSGARSAPA